MGSSAPEAWPLALIGCTCVIAVLREPNSAHEQAARERFSLTKAALCGAAFALAFWLPHIQWIQLYLGPLPWIALAVFMSLWFTVFAICVHECKKWARTIAAVFHRSGTRICHGRAQGAKRPSTACAVEVKRFTFRSPTHPLPLAALESLLIASLWLTRELLQSVLPYGGFSWGRLVYSQAYSPFADAVSWIGLAPLSFLLAFCCALSAVLLTSRSAPVFSCATRLVCGVFLPLLFFSFLPAYADFNAETHKTVRIAGIQANAKAGIFDNREAGEVFQEHIRETERLLEHLERTGEQVDLIIWPENSAEYDIRRFPFRLACVSELAKRANVPIVLGTILEDSAKNTELAEARLGKNGEIYTNSSIVISPDGRILDRYDKHFPVPFGEYMPDRDFYRFFAPDLVDLVQLEYSAGRSEPVLRVNDINYGAAICFDITFDAHAADMASSGAELLLVQTNNADFGKSSESAQQFAIARLQAISVGRALVNISTVGVSEIVDPAGRTLAAVAPYEPNFLIASVPIRKTQTPAMFTGAPLTTAAVLPAALLLPFLFLKTLSKRFRRRRRKTGEQRMRFASDRN